MNRRKFILGLGTILGGGLVADNALAGPTRPRYYFNMKTLRWERGKPSTKNRRFLFDRRKTTRKKVKRKTKKAAKKKFELNPKYEPQRVRYSKGYAPGTIVIDSKTRYLYHVERAGFATRYGVAVGREGLAWRGTARVGRKVEWPSWTPTANMIKREPEKYLKYKDGLPGGPNNPLGARAMYLYKGKRDTALRIHGTTAPWTIGSASSNGCFRMVNDHVIQLYQRVPVGTKVVVI